MKNGNASDSGTLLIPKLQLCQLLSVSEATVDRWLRTDPSFPQPRRLGPGTIRWRRDEVMAFIRDLPRVEYDDHAFDPNDRSETGMAPTA